MEWIQIRFDDDLGDRVQRAAARAGLPLGAFIRDRLDEAVRPLEGAFGYKGPRKPHTLTAYLAHDFAYATGWDDLQDVLRAKGYELAERGGVLILQTVEGQRLCKASEIGQPSSRLMERFDAPFPGHAHHHLETRHLEQKVLPF
ncbi:hypothetical protein [Celeribacter persicus]|jgi:Hemolysin activation/secretion protein|uniref:CopG family transcriptional regulator n=1 Tax=Celeribacter persicus TaxID=1651082 RepID=A0A2T5HTQ5_9RHOB|nr:hypothetical protein [Celeribacter persicus]PTQ74964.1 hypothetical protein C8N42_103256 [Celeribacter persicus]